MPAPGENLGILKCRVGIVSYVINPIDLNEHPVHARFTVVHQLSRWLTAEAT